MSPKCPEEFLAPRKKIPININSSSFLFLNPIVLGPLVLFFKRHTMCQVLLGKGVSKMIGKPGLLFLGAGGWYVR